jgi:hypothetical protein
MDSQKKLQIKYLINLKKHLKLKIKNNLFKNILL